jgi:transposase
MNAYSQDLRARVIASAETGPQTQRSIAATFGVSLSTIEKWLHRKRETGQAAALRQSHGPTRTLQGCAKFIRAEVKQQPDSTLAELCARVATTKGVKASPSMMCRELQHLQLRRKKVAA